MSKQEKLKAIQLCLQYLIPKPTPEREDKHIVQHFEVEIIDKETYQRRKRSFDSGKDVIRETL